MEPYVSSDEFHDLLKRAEGRARKLIDDVIDSAHADTREEPMAYMIALAALLKAGGFSFDEVVVDFERVWESVHMPESPP